MVHKVIDRCKETTSTTGTGNLTLTGAVSGFATMASALTSNGDTSWFCAENGTEWEVFLGTRVSATELARTTVLSSSNSGSAVSFTAAPTLFSTVPGAKLDPGPAFSAYLSGSNQSVTSGASTKVAFNAERFDTHGAFDSTTNYRFQPPVPGYYQVNWSVLAFPGSATLSQLLTRLSKNGTEYQRGGQIAHSSGTLVAVNCTGSALVQMNGSTDYLEVFAEVYGTSPTILAGAGYCSFSGFLARPE